MYKLRFGKEVLCSRAEKEWIKRVRVTDRKRERVNKESKNNTEREKEKMFYAAKKS